MHGSLPPFNRPPSPLPPPDRPDAPPREIVPQQRHLSIAKEMATAGWCLRSGFLSAEQTAKLAGECLERWESGQFRHAGIGRGESWRRAPEVRGDHVLWLDEADLTPAQESYWSELEGLRLALNQTLFVGLFGFEGHFAVYPEGSFYRRHLDQFAGAAHRLVSVLLYLNDDWSEEDGGALRIYLPGEPETQRDIYPIGGTLVTFFSDTFPHEVLPCRRPRTSLTGWFRRRE
jgi:SM-20-related protein